MQTRRAFTLTELIVVIPMIALIFVVVLPLLYANQKSGCAVSGSYGVRAIVQAMMIHASSNTDILPGRSKNGEIPASLIKYSNLGGHSVEGRYAIMLEEALIDSPVMLSWGDSPNRPWTAPNMVTTSNYSFALLELETSTPRQKTWDSVHNPSTIPLACDRLISMATPRGPNHASCKSYWSSTNQAWFGFVGYGDAHVEFEDDPFIDDTRFWAQSCRSDDLFFDEGGAGCGSGSNALMAQKGVSTVTP